MKDKIKEEIKLIKKEGPVSIIKRSMTILKNQIDQVTIIEKKKVLELLPTSTYIDVKKASELSGFKSDKITRLCRQKAFKAEQDAKYRPWRISRKSFSLYLESNS